MTDPKARMAEDRSLRAASRRLLRTDWRLMKQDMAPRALGARISETASDKMRSMTDGAEAFASDNRGLIGAGIAALLAAAGFGLLALRHLGGGPDEPAASDRTSED